MNALLYIFLLFFTIIVWWILLQKKKTPTENYSGSTHATISADVMKYYSNRDSNQSNDANKSGFGCLGECSNKFKECCKDSINKEGKGGGKHCDIKCKEELTKCICTCKVIS